MHIVFALIVISIATLTRLGQLDDSLFFDEIYHVIAGTSWAENGTLALYQGSYERSPTFTKLVGTIFILVGESNVIAARIPSVVFGVMLVCVAALWTRIVAGPAAGWIAAFLLICWPNGIYMSQIVRFYSVHAILFFLSAIAIYGATVPASTLRRRLALLALAAVTLWASLQFQQSTLVGLLAITTWIGCYILFPALWALQTTKRTIIAAFLFLIAFLFIYVMRDGLIQAWGEYRSSPWDRDPTAFHRALRNLYPTLWPLTPLLAVFALAAHPRPASFCLVTAGFGIVIHSFAGVQNIRHIYYISPFLFALWAIGIQAIWRPAINAVLLASRTAFGLQTSNLATLVTVSFGFLFAAFANNALVDTAKGLLTELIPERQLEGDWSEALDVIKPYRDSGAVVVVANDLEAIKYFGGFDVNFSRNWLPSMNEQEFARDPRTGRPLISSPESLAKVVAAYSSGIFVTSKQWWSVWPAYNDITPFLNVFNQHSVSWSLIDVGTSSILVWESDVEDSAQTQRIRQLISDDITHQN